MVETLSKVALRGKTLRWVVCLLLLDERRPMHVTEIARSIESAGYTIDAPRSGKAISDAMRWEIGRERVVQVGRGTYAAGRRMHRSTEYSMRRRVAGLGQSPLESSPTQSPQPQPARQPLGQPVSPQSSRPASPAPPTSLVATSAAHVDTGDGEMTSFPLVEAAMASLVAASAAAKAAFAPFVVDDYLDVAADDD